MFTPAEVENTGRLLALAGAVLVFTGWHPLLGAICGGAGLVCMWRGTAGYDELDWSRDVREDAQREPGGQLRAGDDEAVPVPVPGAPARSRAVRRAGRRAGPGRPGPAPR
jgi:hypothetical protein